MPSRSRKYASQEGIETMPNGYDYDFIHLVGTILCHMNGSTLLQNIQENS